MKSVTLDKEAYAHLILDIERLKLENDIMMNALMEYAFMSDDKPVWPAAALRALRKVRHIEKKHKLD